MLALFLALAATIILTPEVLAQSTSRQYTVWSSVVFARTGDRTPRNPSMVGGMESQLTTVGAQQQYDLGMFFRNRYLLSQEANVSSVDYDHLANAPLQGLDMYSPNPQYLTVEATDVQYASASAQAFMQGFYPPALLNATAVSNNSKAVSYVDDVYISAPLNGYQYPQISTYSLEDPSSIYLAGHSVCTAWASYAVSYSNTPEYYEIEQDSNFLYNAVAEDYATDNFPSNLWDYLFAWEIYDYLNYLSVHDTDAHAILASNEKLDHLRYYSDESLWARLGNTSATNDLTGVEMPSAITSGSISTIAGNMLAYKMLTQLRQAIDQGGESFKLSLMFGDFEPLMSLFAVLRTDILNTNFRGMANFASTAVFELYTNEDPENPSTTFPSEEDLWVNFYFRNGTDDDYVAYPILGNGPDGYEMRWLDFENSMWSVALGEVNDWCNMCDASTLFCAVWTMNPNNDESSSDPQYASPSGGSSRNGLSPAVSGVIGAIIALVIAGILFGLAMLIGGLRLRRVSTRKGSKSNTSDLGGFKGSRKLRSDQDLTIPKGGAGAHVEPVDPTSPVPGGHERVGSWELKEPISPISGRNVQQRDGDAIEGANSLSAGSPMSACRPSFEHDDQFDQRATNPFEDPVRPDERV